VFLAMEEPWATVGVGAMSVDVMSKPVCGKAPFIQNGHINPTLMTFPNNVQLNGFIECNEGFKMVTKAVTCVCTTEKGQCATLIDICKVGDLNFDLGPFDVATVRSDPPLPGGIFSGSTLAYMLNFSSWLTLGHFLAMASYNYLDSRVPYVGLKATFLYFFYAFSVLGFGIDNEHDPNYLQFPCYRRRVFFNFASAFAVMLLVCVLEILRSFVQSKEESKKLNSLKDGKELLQEALSGKTAPTKINDVAEDKSPLENEDTEDETDLLQSHVTDSAFESNVSDGSDADIEDKRKALHDRIKLMERKDQLIAYKNVRTRLEKLGKIGKWNTRIHGVKLILWVITSLAVVGLIVCLYRSFMGDCKLR